MAVKIEGVEASEVLNGLLTSLQHLEALSNGKCF